MCHIKEVSLPIIAIHCHFDKYYPESSLLSCKYTALIPESGNKQADCFIITHFLLYETHRYPSTAFIREAERLKNVLRSAHTSAGGQESTTEHAWRICLLALIFENWLAQLDFARVPKVCILHHPGEAIRGDIPANKQTADSNKAEQENADLLTLLSPLPAFLQSSFPYGKKTNMPPARKRAL